MISVYRADQLKRFAPFSCLNHSFISSLNVKVCIGFIAFLQISLSFFYLSRVMLDERFVHQLQIIFFVSSRNWGRVKSWRTGGGGASHAMIRLISNFSNFMTSQPGSQTIVIQILSNLSRSKGNQAMKFGLVKEYNMRNIFVEKSYTKFGRTSPKPFSGKLKLTISLNQWSKVLYCLFLLYGKLRAIKMY